MSLNVNCDNAIAIHKVVHMRLFKSKVHDSQFRMKNETYTHLFFLAY